MGVLDHVSDFFDCSGGSSSSRHKTLQTVEVRVLIDCEGCERKVRGALEGMKGVREVEIEPKAQKVSVVGYVDVDKVVSRIMHRTGKRAEPYPFVPFDAVAHPYAAGVYDIRAPVGYVRNSSGVDPHVSRLARASSTEVRYTTAFSDDNAAACTIM